MVIRTAQLRSALRAFDFQRLFIEELNWDRFRETQWIEAGEQSYRLDGVAQKRGLAVFICQPGPDGAVPDRNTRIKIERKVAKLHYEHLIVFVDTAQTTQLWQWVKRERGKPAVPREQHFYPDIKEETILQKLSNLEIPLDAEELLTLPDVQQQVSSTFDVNAERVTKKFYEKYQKEHEAFRDFIRGITEEADRQWYASLMLNRLMFVYFIQKKRFLDGDDDYLRNRLERLAAKDGKDQFHSFYRAFLLRLFHDGLATPEAARSAEINELIGDIPYLNGGIFELHELERSYSDIQIPDAAFTRLFAFFNTYQWHLDDRPLKKDTEINPDVLGYIFEKYVNQKQMGAYYTKEDITEYIGKNTIVPFLFDAAKKECAIAFRPGSALWRLLQDEPDRYIYPAVRKGVDLPLPADIAAGIDDIPQRGGWNRPAADAYALPTEIWREHIARRQRYEETWTKLVNGEVTEINDLITLNLDIRQFAQDVIQACEGPELLRAFYQAITKITVLDPTCGSGAFLFAALNILQPLYDACLDRMEGFIEDASNAGDGANPAKYQDFRAILAEVDKHPNRRYFILKSIILNNLYGVDIMEEATEICKLRLFLKLVSTVESSESIEALPDIDFNIRAGNTLVGYATFEEVRVAIEGRVQLTLDLDQKMPRFERQIELADEAFKRFQDMQTGSDCDPSLLHLAKEHLREQLSNLRTELNRHLSGDYAIEGGSLKVNEWCKSHQPFHWFVEFYRILRGGGFDVIVGNPPYVEYRDVIEQYSVIGFKTIACADLYALVLERAYSLIHEAAYIGAIVPISIFGTDGFLPLQKETLSQLSYVWASHYANRPSQLFEEAQKRLTILLGRKGVRDICQIYSTRYFRWTSEERESLFYSRLSYQKLGAIHQIFPSSLEKLGSSIEVSAYTKIAEARTAIEALMTSEATPFKMYYTRKFGYFLAFLDFIPRVEEIISGNEKTPSELKMLNFASEQTTLASIAALSSSTFFWFWNVLSDCRNLNKRDITSFRINFEKDPAGVESLALLGKRYLRQLKSTSKVMTKSGLYIQTFEYSSSKPIIDEIDLLLSQQYGFTYEELDFIVHYDVKYRMGKDLVEAES